MADHPFAKDLGYLFPFFERVAAHAAALPEAQGAQLRALLDGEAERWRSIAAILEGSSAEGSMDAGSSEAAVAEVEPAKASHKAATGSWTVGPLNRG